MPLVIQFASDCVAVRAVRVWRQGHPMDAGFEKALDTCLENAEHASIAPGTVATGAKQAKEKKVD